MGSKGIGNHPCTRYDNLRACQCEVHAQHRPETYQVDTLRVGMSDERNRLLIHVAAGCKTTELQWNSAFPCTFINPDIRPTRCTLNILDS